MRGSKVIVFVIEANKSSRSDENYIRALMNSLYSKEFQIKSGLLKRSEYKNTTCKTPKMYFYIATWIVNIH